MSQILHIAHRIEVSSELVLTIAGFIAFSGAALILTALT